MGGLHCSVTAKKGQIPIRNLKTVLNRFTILFDDRLKEYIYSTSKINPLLYPLPLPLKPFGKYT
jgi:hypothetical protein